MEGKSGDEFEAAAIATSRMTCASTSASSLTATATPTSGRWKPSAAAGEPSYDADALPCFVEPKSIALFEEFGRAHGNRSAQPLRGEAGEVQQAAEHRGAHDEAHGAPRYLPAINSYAAEVAGHINAIRSACAGADTDQQEELLRRLLLGIKEIDTQLRALGKLHHETLEIESEQEKANTYAHEVIPVMDSCAPPSTGLEVLVDRDHWPVPTYNDILFYV